MCDLIVVIKFVVFYNINSEVGWSVIIELGEYFKWIVKFFVCIFVF